MMRDASPVYPPAPALRLPDLNKHSSFIIFNLKKESNKRKEKKERKAMKKRRRLFVSVALSLLLRPEPVLANADGFCFHSSYERQLRMASQTRRHKKFQELKY
jgi:RNA:NAD 2'-phosphotransferase (TPT1/KptA family)